jgi:hypothetical protein
MMRPEDGSAERPSTRRVRFVNDRRGPRLEDWNTREIIEQVEGVTIIATPGEPVRALVLFVNIEVHADAIMDVTP